MKRYEIDGTDFSTLDEFYQHVSTVLGLDDCWGRNLDAFNDILCGGFGTPDEGFILIWKNSALSEERLGKEVFGQLIEIIRDHGPGGSSAESRVELELN